MRPREESPPVPGPIPTHHVDDARLPPGILPICGLWRHFSLSPALLASSVSGGRINFRDGRKAGKERFTPSPTFANSSCKSSAQFRAKFKTISIWNAIS